MKKIFFQQQNHLKTDKPNAKQSKGTHNYQAPRYHDLLRH